MSLYSRSGRPRPQGGGFERTAWYLMRLSAVALFVLALGHYIIEHVVFDPSNQTAEWIANNRWNSIFWRVFDWLLLQMVLLHGFLGIRTVVSDYVKGGARVGVMMAIWLVGIGLFVAGTVVVLTMPLKGG
jgi:succinate dehydrogenase / fumarate reductase membrane anchor subunit